MGGRRHDRQAGCGEAALQGRRAFLVAHAQLGMGRDVADAGQCCAGDGRRQRGREDEARTAGADEIDRGGARGDVAADHAERLGERALDDIDLVERSVALGHAGAALAVHADRMHLVEVGEGAVAMREVADLADRRDVAVHRIDRFEGDDLGRRGIGRRQELLEMAEVVVPEDLAHRTGMADAGDHRGVIEGVGVELAAWQQRAQRLQGRLVGDVARGEDESRLLGVQLRELALERDVQGVGAGDVARAAGARALAGDRRLHGLEHHRMLAHGEVVVAAPHRDVTRRAVVVKARAREGADDALQFGEHAVASLVAQAIEMSGEKSLVVHSVPVSPAGRS